MLRAFLLAGLTTILVALGLSYVSLRWVDREQKAELVALAERSAIALDLQVSNWKTALSVLSNSNAMVRDFDIGTLRWEAERLGKELGGWAVLLPAEDLSTQIFNTGRSGTEPVRIAKTSPEFVQAVERSRKSGKAELSDVFIGTSVPRPIVAAVEYTTASTGENYVVVLAFDAAEISKGLDSATLPAGNFISVVDGSERIVGRSSQLEEFFLKPLPPWFLDAVKDTPAQETAVVRGPGVAGTPNSSYTFARRALASAPQWHVAIARPSGGLTYVSYATIIPLLGSFVVFAVGMTIGLLRHAARRHEGDLQAAFEQSERERTLRAELEHALADLHTAEDARNNMLGVLGHEMRTPVLSALAAIQLFPKHLRVQDHRGYLGLAEKGLKVLQSLIEDILDLARIKAGELRLDNAVFSLPGLLAEVADIMQPVAERHKLAFLKDWTAEDIPVVGDSTRIRQILINLLSNAFKYTRQGSVTLSGTWHEEVNGTCHIRICVTDTGTGIAEDKLRDIFESFVRLDQARNGRISGLGLGLPISERLAIAMGGRIDVSSRLGEGSRFCLELDLPVALQTQEEAAGTEPTPGATPLAGLTVLVVEDHPLQAALVTAVLEAMQARTTIAAMGHEALEAAKRDRFDVILIDLGLPDMSGVEVIRNLKALGSTARHIALSANPASLNDEERGLFDAIATKTASKSELERLLKGVVERA